MMVTQSDCNSYKSILNYDSHILNDKEVRNFPYYDSLIDIRQELEHLVEGFPTNRCGHASYVVRRVLQLKIVEVDYTPPTSFKGHFSRKHFVNVDVKSQVYIDLTQDQFVPRLPGLVIMPSSTGIMANPKEIDLSYLLSDFSEQEINLLNSIASGFKF